MKLKIESTETGEVFNARFETSIDKLKYQVNLVTRIPIQDQILLIGPPYKILDTQYGPNLNVEDKRIFVFNRKSLSSEGPELQRVKLLPFEVSKPLNEFSQLPSSLAQSVSPSAQYLLEFEKYFQEQLMRGQCYETFIVEVFKSCKESVLRHQIQLDGVDAAISNLKDTYQAIKKPFDSLEKRLLAQQSRHQELLEGFNGNIEKLREVTLHPALISSIEKQKSEFGLSGSTLDINTSLVDAPITTLYDCIPVERERAYHQQCLESFQKVEDQLRRVHVNYESVSSGVNSLTFPTVDFERLNQLIEQLSVEVDSETSMIAEMKKNYQFVYDTITSATISPNSASAAVNNSMVEVTHSNLTSSALTNALQAAPPSAAIDLETLVSDLARRKFNQERQQFFPAMEAKVIIVKAIKQEIEDSQNLLVNGIYDVMRSIAQQQTDIQFKLKKDVDWMKKMTNGSNEYFKHLEHLTCLPNAYEHLLHEIVRRKAYNGVFEGEVRQAFEKISQLRSVETKEREVFMSKYGLCLPPIFFRLIPTLKDKPPYFQPSITDEQFLPDVHYEDLDRQQFLGMMHEMSSPSRDGRSNYIYSDQQQLTHLSRLDQMPKPLVLDSNFSELASNITEGFPATQSQIDELLSGGGQYRSNTNSVMMIGKDDIPSNLSSQINDFPSAPPSNRKYSNAGGGSVILPAQAKDDGVEELQMKYDQQVYENSKLLTMVEDMRKQLAAANSHIEVLNAKRGRTRTQSDVVFVEPAPDVSTIAINVTVSESAPEPSTTISTTVNSRQSLEQMEELIDSFIESYRFIQSSLLEETSIQNQLQLLETHGAFKDIPVNELKLLKSTFQLKVSGLEEASNAENSNEVLGSLIASVFSMIGRFRQCLSHVLRNPVITFMDFRAGDIALFMPLQNEDGKTWIAFNSNCPYRFLAEDSSKIFLERSREKERKYILGRIILIDDFVTTAENNPYRLPMGTEYHVCHCEPLKTKVSAKGGATYAAVVKAGGDANSGAVNINVRDGISGGESSSGQN